MTIPSEEVLIHAISHPIRRAILEILYKDPQTFTQILNYFDLFFWQIELPFEPNSRND
ncbi:MAG: hypothetical protein GF308_20260 [Candidatus Heimdallarchaeota archaeon]|nr:hypothetical protein [Candidatus Heimdallarchaeota archaeon]